MKDKRVTWQITINYKGENKVIYDVQPIDVKATVVFDKINQVYNRFNLVGIECIK